MSKNIPADMENTQHALEDLRHALHQTVAEHDGELLHPSVIAASQLLDEAVLAAQRQLAQSDNVTSPQGRSTTQESGSVGSLRTLAST